MSWRSSGPPATEATAADSHVAARAGRGRRRASAVFSCSPRASGAGGQRLVNSSRTSAWQGWSRGPRRPHHGHGGSGGPRRRRRRRLIDGTTPPRWRCPGSGRRERRRRRSPARAYRADPQAGAADVHPAAAPGTGGRLRARNDTRPPHGAPIARGLVSLRTRARRNPPGPRGAGAGCGPLRVVLREEQPCRP